MKDDLEIPTFLKRTETEAQAEARRKKHAPKDASKGLKVITPPDPKISAAIAKDFAEKKKTEKLATAKSAVDKINEARAKDGLRPYKQGKGKTAAEKEKAGLPPIKKKTIHVFKNSVVEKALKARDEMHEKAKAAISATNGKKPVKTKKTSIHRYDWTGAEENAKKGIVPAAPDFSAWTHRYFRDLLADTEKLVKAKNLKALQAMRFKRDNGSPGMVNRYRKIAITALSFKK